MRRRTFLAAGIAAALPIPNPTAGESFPELIHLPLGYRPEGIAIGNGPTLYVGSTVDGGIYRADLCSGRGEVFIAGRAGAHAGGLELDDYGRLWVCGLYTFGYGVVVYDSRSGERLREYPLEAEWVNDATATSEGIYCTDSRRAVMYRLPNGPSLPDSFEALPLPPGIGDANAWNNGVVATPDGRIITVQSGTGRLFNFDPRTCEAVQIDAPLVQGGDGLLLIGSKLYVARNAYNLVAKLQLNGTFTAATLISETRHTEFAFPTTLASFGPHVYVANARSFTVDPTPTTPYYIVRIPR
ncbi:MAG TPA: hypothetical protein VF062_09490 [Candidatus Limnocylindrales bacterium]